MFNEYVRTHGNKTSSHRSTAVVSDTHDDRPSSTDSDSRSAPERKQEESQDKKTTTATAVHPRHSPHKPTLPMSPVRPRSTGKKDKASFFSHLASGNLHTSPKGKSPRRHWTLPEGSPHQSPRLPGRSDAKMGLIELGTEPTPVSTVEPGKSQARRKLMEAIEADDDE